MAEASSAQDERTDRVQAMIDRAVREAVALIEQRLDSEKEALKHQAEEYKRRLEQLNGEHATLALMKTEYVSREGYNKDMDRLRIASEASIKEAQIAARKQEEGMQANRRNSTIAWIGCLTALIGWVITILLRYLPASH
jgi:hypothetical protein